MKQSVCVALALASSCVLAAEPVPSLAAVAEGEPACYSQEVRFPGSRTLLAKLCVVEHMATPSEYYALIEGRQVAGGFDDEVAEGVRGSFQGMPLTLRCPAILKAPDTVPQERIEEMRKKRPNASEEELRRMAIRADTVETGRDCSLRAANLVEVVRVRIWH